MATIIPLGEPVNDAERTVIAYLRDHGPRTWTVYHNFLLAREGEAFEVDLALLTPHAVYLVDIKGTRGLIDVAGPRWYPEGRPPILSPLAKLRQHARIFKGLLTASAPTRPELEGVYVGAAVILTAPEAHLRDPDSRDSPDVITLQKCIPFFQDKNRVPARFARSISDLLGFIRSTLEGKAQRRNGPLQFGHWQVAEKLSETDHYTEYRAHNIFAGGHAGHAVLRVYQADPYLPAQERAAQRSRIANAYQALSQLPPHPAILGAKDFFPTEAEDRFVLVTEDASGQALHLHLTRPNLALTLDQKFHIARDVLSALAHAHTYAVVHRALSPATILVGRDGQARLTGFEFARIGTDRSHSIAEMIADELDLQYLAPECQGHPETCSPASDVFAAGLVFYELFTGTRPFADVGELMRQRAVFPLAASAYRNELPSGFDAWLQALCAFIPEQRPTATAALHALEPLLAAPRSSAHVEPSTVTAPDYYQLPKGYALTRKYIVQERLGRPGAFGVAYKVFDSLGDIYRALKLILRDRHSVLERLKREYRTLRNLPPHPHVVKVIDADFLPNDGPPFLVFEYLSGLDVGEMVAARLCTPTDGLQLARDVASGLVHLHRHGVYHCDIKPRNLLWTDAGTQLIDFNVAVAAAELSHGGGSRRYLPPDLDLAALPTEGELADRDIFALAVTVYEVITGRYPWDAEAPPPEQPARDPRELSGFADLAPDLVTLLLKATAPHRSERFASAVEFQTSLLALPDARVTRSTLVPSTTVSPALSPAGEPLRPNHNPFVSYLLTLYSQSPHSNRGTRGLDAWGEKTYVTTALDRELLPAVLQGEFDLVIITGNAGDGKTAFLQRLTAQARQAGAEIDETLPNGCWFSLHNRHYRCNYDGSQDEGDQDNDAVLETFFAPYQGGDAGHWPQHETRLIAINEGRLVDFLESHVERFPYLAQQVRQGLDTGIPGTAVAVINLNLRNVVAVASEGTLLERQLRRLTAPEFWAPCEHCDLNTKCFVLHNVRTFQNETAGARVIERLQFLYTLTQLRNRLHITLRDLRSAVAFMLAGTRDCEELHALYAAGELEAIAGGFYFSSWSGGINPTGDRLLDLLSEIDIGNGTDPHLDRRLDFLAPTADPSLFTFEQRSDYDQAVLSHWFDTLPRGWSGKVTEATLAGHQQYVAMMRRRQFFERRDERWRTLVPYRSAGRLLELLTQEQNRTAALDDILHAINRGEGLPAPAQLGGGLALQVRTVERGTLRSYRLFPRERFTLHVHDQADRARFLEHSPTELLLCYRMETGQAAELRLDLDRFEMLYRLNQGYYPTTEEQQGYAISLAVFKHVLAAAPYQEVLLTTGGQEFHRIRREPDGRLQLTAVPVETH